MLKRLTHLHLARAYEVFVDPPTVILEIVTGRTLARRIQDETRLGLEETIAIGVQLCSVLQYLHRQPLLHLDLKPSNIVCERGIIKLLDLSIARRPGPLRGVVGTPRYMAPEQAQSSVVSPATDVWGASMVLFETLTGQLPFSYTETSAEKFPQLSQRAARLRGLRRGVPLQLQRIIDESLARAPEDRPSLGDLRCTLQELSDSMA